MAVVPVQKELARLWRKALKSVGRPQFNVHNQIIRGQTRVRWWCAREATSAHIINSQSYYYTAWDIKYTFYCVIVFWTG